MEGLHIEKESGFPRPGLIARGSTMAFFICFNINGHVRNLNWRYPPYIRPYMIQYLYFRILEFPWIIWTNNQLDGFLRVLS